MVHFCESSSGAIWLSELEPLVDISDGIQAIQYFISKEYGRILVINEELQHVEAWAPFYHEIVVHLPCSFIKKPKRALIIGGGSLFAAEELLKYDSIEAINLVDHDLNVIKATMCAYPERGFILNDARLKICEQKFEMFLPTCQDKYDIIVNDCFDMYSVDKTHHEDYYEIVENLLSDCGICSDLVYRNIYIDEVTNGALRRIAGHLNRAASMIAIPEYPGVLHILTMWGKNKNLTQDKKNISNFDQLSMQSRNCFKLYSPRHIQFYLYLPPYLKKYIK